MPLVIIGLLFTIGFVIYALVRYANSGEIDTRPVRERYWYAFPPKSGEKGPDVGADKVGESATDSTSGSNTGDTDGKDTSAKCSANNNTDDIGGSDTGGESGNAGSENSGSI